MRRGYGCDLFFMIDQPMNRGTISAMRAEAFRALDEQEPRIRIRSIAIASAEPGEVIIDIEGDYLPDGQAIKLEGIVIS